MNFLRDLGIPAAVISSIIPIDTDDTTSIIHVDILLLLLLSISFLLSFSLYNNLYNTPF